MAKIKRLEIRLEDLFQKEEFYWRQRIWRDSTEEVVSVVEDYFTDTFGSSHPSPEATESLLSSINHHIPSHVLDSLEQPFTTEEVTRAFLQMGLTKAP
ncbi:hypothetical protein TorRG33x02_210250, partial [Trema orientale]